MAYDIDPKQALHGYICLLDTLLTFDVTQQTKFEYEFESNGIEAIVIGIVLLSLPHYFSIFAHL